MNRWTLAALCAAGWIALTPGDAEAGLSLGLDIGPNFVLTDQDPFEAAVDGFGESAGIGVSGRLGWAFKQGFLKITPEAKLGFESPGGPNAFRVLGGVRLTLAEGFAPIAFAHVGATTGDIEAFTWDVGLGLDLTFIPVVDLGAFVSYNRAESSPNELDNLVGEINAPGSWEWVQIGISGTLDF